MRKNVAVLVLALGLLANTNCLAAINVGLSGGPVILDVGQSATFSVGISGVLATSPTGIDFLSVTVKWDDPLGTANILGTQTAITAGAVIPTVNPGFLFLDLVPPPGQADALYDGGFGGFDQIVSDGTFFSFSVTAQSAGTTRVYIDSVFAFDSNNEPLSTEILLPIDVVVNGTAAVPEPSTLLLFSLGLGALGLVRARRRSCSAGKTSLPMGPGI